VFLICVVLILGVIGTFIAKISYETWKISPILLIFYRAGFTFSVFDKVVALGYPFGFLHGYALLDVTQKIVSTEVLHYKEPHIITSTLIGPSMLDFGILGVVATGIAIGLYLGIMYRYKISTAQACTIQTCLYAVALTHTFIIIEVGIQLSSVLLYLSLLYLMITSNKIKAEAM
jgi:hypothetical protein